MTSFSDPVPVHVQEVDLSCGETQGSERVGCPRPAAPSGAGDAPLQAGGGGARVRRICARWRDRGPEGRH